MLLLAGAVPVEKLPLIQGKIILTESGVNIEGHDLDINRGFEAMATSAYHTCSVLGVEGPTALVAGDIGKRDGSEKVYEYIAENLPQMGVKVLTLHYIMPDLHRNKRVLKTIVEMGDKKPFLIADAGSMYVAKTGGDSQLYDLFTPDLGEVAFLADDQADHPTYTRGFIFHMEDDVPELIRRAYEANNCPKTIFVKGSTDYICQDGVILQSISEPKIEAMEPIGGTGDLITGMISALVYAGKEPAEACIIAGLTNRKAGELSNPTPATQVQDILKFLPAALEAILAQRG
jgi:NAD(P)H-hydrate repair Nnr-like enzyme with NAD(P)H-hydrate dehydratase domain